MAEGLPQSVSSEITIAKVFGEYTSMKTGFTITWGGLPENYPADALKFAAIGTAFVQQFQNKVLVMTGRKPYWTEEGAAPQEEVPEKKKRVARKPTDGEKESSVDNTAE